MKRLIFSIISMAILTNTLHAQGKITPQTTSPAGGAPQVGNPQAIPQTGRPAPGLPQTGAPAPGIPQTGTPAPGIPQTGAPAAGIPQTGAPNSAVPQTGAPANVPQVGPGIGQAPANSVNMPGPSSQANSPLLATPAITFGQTVANMQNNFLTGAFFNGQTSTGVTANGQANTGNTAGSLQTNAQTGATSPAARTSNVQSGLVGVNLTPTASQSGVMTGTASTQGGTPQSSTNQNSQIGVNLTPTANQTSQNTTAAGQIGNASTAPMSQFIPTPWFLNPSVSSQFNFSSTQTAALNQAYQNALSAYNAGLNQINTNLSASQQQQAVGALRKNFFQTLTGAVNQANLTPQQQAQYNQLYLQRHGYTAFNDTSLQQKLMLNSSQVQQLDLQGQTWLQQLNALQSGYAADPVGTTLRYNDLVKQFRQQFNTILTPQQQQELQQLTGGSFAFPPGLIYQQVGGQ